MNPYLTSAGRALLVGALLFVVVGTLTGRWVLILLGVLQLGVLAMAYYALLHATLVLERRLLAVKVEPPEAAEVASLHVGEPVELSLVITNRAGARLRGLHLSAHLGTGLELVRDSPRPLELPGYSRLECKVSVTTQESGRWMLHGFQVWIQDLLGLVAVGEYVSAPVSLKFLPRVAVPRRSAQSFQARSKDREGLHLVRHRGSGMELRELREHNPGDPFRSIAWKATARSGRLMVREVESEFVLNTYLCLDISSTMRGGRSGKEGQVATKLEHGLRLAMGMAEQISQAGDRVGLVSFDEKIYGHLRPREGKAHLGQIMQHLIGVRHVVDEDLTEYGEQEVGELLARYLMIQERLDVRHRARRPSKGVGQGLDYWSFSRELVDPHQGSYDMEMLEQWASAAVVEERERFYDACLDTGVLHYGKLSAMRRFCHLRGLEIPYRVETRLGQKERGLVQCLEEIRSQARDAHTVVIISDLCGIMNTEMIARGLRAVLAKGHKIAFFAPFTPDYVSPPGPRGQMLHELFALAEVDDRHGILRVIQGLGIPVLPVGPQDTLSYLLQQMKIAR